MCFFFFLCHWLQTKGVAVQVPLIRISAKSWLVSQIQFFKKEKWNPFIHRVIYAGVCFCSSKENPPKKGNYTTTNRKKHLLRLCQCSFLHLFLNQASIVRRWSVAGWLPPNHAVLIQEALINLIIIPLSEKVTLDHWTIVQAFFSARSR